MDKKIELARGTILKLSVVIIVNAANSACMRKFQRCDPLELSVLLGRIISHHGFRPEGISPLEGSLFSQKDHSSS